MADFPNITLPPSTVLGRLPGSAGLGEAVPFSTVLAAGLPDVIVAGGPTGDASHVAAVTYNSKGQLTAVSSIAIASAALAGYLSGCGTSTDNLFNMIIAAGLATSDDGTTSMSLSAITKKTNVAWAVGTAAGGLDTGAIASSTWYYVWVIERPDTGVVDALVSLSATAPTMPANYTKKRRIGSFKTDGSSHVFAYSQFGDEFLWQNGPSDDFNSTTLGTTATLFPMNVPIGFKVTARLRASISVAGATNGVLFNSPDEFAQVASATTGNMSLEVEVTSTTNSGMFDIRTDTSGRVRAVSTAASTVVHGGAYGWIDARGQR